MIKNILLFLTLHYIFVSCSSSESKQECDCSEDSLKIARAEEICAKKNSINELKVVFLGYFLDEADTINIKIIHVDGIIENYNDRIPSEIKDSLRHWREYTIEKKIMLTDTVLLTIKNEPTKKVYGFKYKVRAHFGNYCTRGWGCDFYELIVDKDTIEGTDVDFTKQNWDILKYKNFKNYYYETRQHK